MNAVAAVPEPSCLEKLPKELLNYILRFLGDKKTMHRDLHSCETTCKALKAVVEDDLLWGFFRLAGSLGNGDPVPPYSEDPRIPTHRFHCRVERSLTSVRANQRSPLSAIDISALGQDMWNQFLGAAIIHCVACHLPLGTQGRLISVSVRQDMADMLKVLVDHHIHLQLLRASLLAIETTSEDEYPVVHRKHIKLANKLYNISNFQFPNYRPRPNGFVPLGLDEEEDTTNEEDWATRLLEDAEARDRIVRTLAYKAGITMLSNDAYGYVWMHIVRCLIQLLKPGCVHNLNYEGSSAAVSDYFTLVPHHLEQSSDPSFAPYHSMKVYGPEQHRNNFGKDWNEGDDVYVVEMDNESDDDLVYDEEMDSESDEEEEMDSDSAYNESIGDAEDGLEQMTLD